MVIKVLITVLTMAFLPTVSADEVPPAYVDVAQTYRVPPDVLYAIALTESGRETNGVYRPWPWTLNIGGKAFFYTSRAEAQTALDDAIKKKIRPLGVGLMQIEWPIHYERVSSSAEMLDPYTNLHLSGQILTEYRKNKDLWSAVGRYHSGTPHLAAGYQGRVAKRLFNFLARTVESDHDSTSTIENAVSSVEIP